MRSILILFGAVILLAGCKNGTPGSPKNTVLSFIEAAKTGNLNEVKKYISKSDASLIEIGQTFLAKMDPARAKEIQDKMSEKFKEETKGGSYELKDEKIDGDNATVNVSFALDGKTDTRPFSLVKEDGQWKVSLISTGMKNSGDDNSDMHGDMKNMNMDSLQNAISDGVKEFDKLDKDSLKQAINEGMKEFNKLDKDSLKHMIDKGVKEFNKIDKDSLKRALQKLKDLSNQQ